MVAKIAKLKAKDKSLGVLITNKKRTANQSSTGLSQPVGNAMKSSSSGVIISQSEGSVNPYDENVYSDRSSDTVSNRTLLAEALEGFVASTDPCSLSSISSGM